MRFLRRIFWFAFLWVSGCYTLFKKLVLQPPYIFNSVNLRRDVKLHRLVKFANQFVEGYRFLYQQVLVGGSAGFERRFISKAPITDKKTMKQAGRNMLADRYRNNFDYSKFDLNRSLFGNLFHLFWGKDFLFSMSTGGTTGTPLTVYKNRLSLLIDGLLFLRGWYMTGWELGDKVLVFYPSYYDYSFSFINTIDWLTGIKLFFFSSLSDTTIEHLVDEINSFKPNLVVTFPSYAYDAAQTIQKARLKLKYFPKSIEVSGEVLFQHQRKKVEKIFHSKVYDSYGTLEFGMVAHECFYQNGLHVYEDIILLENIDKDKNPDTILATRYDSNEMPMIRYLVGDCGIVQHLQTQCACGRRGLILKNIKGRVDDYIVLPDGRRVYPTVFRQLINSCNELHENAILESRILQSFSGVIVLEIIISDDSFQENIRSYLGKTLNTTLPDLVGINITFVNSMRGRRKFRFIERSTA